MGNWRFFSACRLQLNPIETQTTWLGSSREVFRANITDIPILSRSPSLHVTLASTPTQRRRCLHMSLLCTRPVSTNSGNCVLWAEHSPLKQSGFGLMLPRLLQLAVVCSVQLSCAKGTVCAEHHCMPCYQIKKTKPHHSSVASAALATSPPTSAVQDCLPHSSGTVGSSANDGIHLVSNSHHRQHRSKSDRMCAVPHNSVSDISFTAFLWNSFHSLWEHVTSATDTLNACCKIFFIYKTINCERCLLKS